MSSQPECRRCGDYVHRGLVVCEECSGILADEMKELRAENARLAAAHQAAADELAEALYNLRLMTMQADANYKRAKDAEEQLRQIVMNLTHLPPVTRDALGFIVFSHPDGRVSAPVNPMAARLEG